MMNNIKNQHPFFKIEEVSPTEALVHTPKLGSFYIVMNFNEEASETSKQASIYNQGFKKETYWIPQDESAKYFMVGDYSSKTLEDAIEDVINLYDSGYLIEGVYHLCQHAVEEWFEVPGVIQATYEALDAVMKQAS